MRKTMYRCFLPLLALLLVIAFTGCTTASTEPTAATAATNTVAPTQAPTPVPTPEVTTSTPEHFLGYPMDCADSVITLYNFNQGMGLAPKYTTFEESPWHFGLNERIGVTIEWSLPAQGADYTQAKNLMLASGDLPDIFYSSEQHKNANDYINDGYIITLTDYIEEDAPAFYDYLQKKPDFARSVRTDSGEYYTFPFFREDLLLGSYQGPMIRQDLLDKAGLGIPVTLDDWDTAMYAFKDLVQIPFGTWSGTVFTEIFSNPYGFTLDFYVGEDGLAHYGYYEPAYRDFLELLSRWYADGIIDPDFATNNSAGLQTKVLNSLVGATRTSGGTLTNYLKQFAQLGVTDEWIPVAYPVMKEGDVVRFTKGEPYFLGIGAVITTACADVPLACRVLDYFFTPEGIEYTNYGAVGNVMNYDANGKPVYTQEALTNPDGIDAAFLSNIGNTANSIGIMLIDAWAQRVVPIAVESEHMWYDGVDQSSRFPAITPTSAENAAIASSLSQIETYVSEMYYKFIMGEEPLENFDTYIQKVKELGIEDILKVKTIQLDRYNNR